MRRRSVVFFVLAVTLLAATAVSALGVSGSLSFLGLSTTPSVQFSDPSVSPTQAFTLEAWISIPTASLSVAFQTVLGRNSGTGGSGWAIQMASGKYACAVQTNVSPRVAWGTTLSADTWTHVACVYDGRVMQPYRAGVPDGTTFTGPDQRWAPVLANMPMTLGSEDTVTGRNFLGAIDNVRIWSVARSAPDIFATYNTKLTVATAGWSNLVSYVAFRPTTRALVPGFEAVDFKAAAPGHWKWSSATGSLKLLTDSTACSASGCGGNFNALHPFSYWPSGGVYRQSSNSVGNSLSSFTLEAWIQLASAVGTQTIVARNSGSGQPGISLSVTNGALTCACNGVVTTGSAVPLTTWQHVACTYQYYGSDTPSNVQLYQSGARDGSLTVSYSGIPQLSPTQSFVIGYEDTVSGHAFGGGIDNVRVWSTARLPSDIASTYATLLRGTERYLVSYATFRFNSLVPTYGMELVENTVGTAVGSWTPVGWGGSGAPAPFACLESGCGSPFVANTNECATDNGGCGFAQCTDTAAGRTCDGWNFVTTTTTHIAASGTRRACVYAENNVWNVIYNDAAAGGYQRLIGSTDAGTTWGTPVLPYGASNNLPDVDCIVSNGQGVVLSSFAGQLTCSGDTAGAALPDGSWVVACSSGGSQYGSPILLAYHSQATGLYSTSYNTGLQTQLYASLGLVYSPFDNRLHMYFKDSGASGGFRPTANDGLMHSATFDLTGLSGWSAPDHPNAVIVDAPSAVVYPFDDRIHLFHVDDAGTGKMHYRSTGYDASADSYDPVNSGTISGMGDCIGQPDAFCSSARCMVVCIASGNVLKIARTVSNP